MNEISLTEVRLLFCDLHAKSGCYIASLVGVYKLLQLYVGSVLRATLHTLNVGIFPAGSEF